MSRARTVEQAFLLSAETPPRDRPLVMYRDCPFCGRTRRRASVDELVAAVMACRDGTAPERRGSLAA